MKHCFNPIASTRNEGKFFIQCSLSHHLVMAKNTTHPQEVVSVDEVERFSRKNTGKKLSFDLYKACANALLKRHGAVLEYEDQSYAGVQKTFRLFTRYGPALVTPLDSWIACRFLDAEGRTFPFPTAGRPGQWNFHSADNDLSKLLEEFADGIALVTGPSPSAGAYYPEGARFELLPTAVMESQAGFYVGCSCKTGDEVYPHSRYSEYFPKREQAQAWLEQSLETCSF